MALAAGMSPPSSAVRMLFLKLCHGHHHHLYPKGGAEGAQQFRGTGSFCAKGEVFTAEQRPGVAVFHDAAHKLLRAQRLDCLKVRGEVILHPKAVDQGVLILGRKQALALHFIFHRQAEGEHRRGCIMGLCPLHSPFDHRPVADMDAVKVAHGHGGAFFGLRQRQRGKLRNDLHGSCFLYCSITFHEQFFHPEHPAGDVGKAKERPSAAG